MMPFLCTLAAAEPQSRGMQETRQEVDGIRCDSAATMQPDSKCQESDSICTRWHGERRVWAQLWEFTHPCTLSPIDGIAPNTYAPPGRQHGPSPARGQREVSGVSLESRFAQDSQDAPVRSERTQTLPKRPEWFALRRQMLAFDWLPL